MKLDTKFKKNQKLFFSGKKNFKIFFVLEKWKNEKNNGGKRAFFDEKNRNSKNRKIEKIDFFVPFVCTPKIFYETTLWCYVVPQNFFYDFLTPSWYLKFCLKKIFSEKKARVLFFRGKKKKKIEKFENLADRSKSAKNI